MSDCDADHRPSKGSDLPLLFTVSGLCGSAKTHSATRWAHHTARWGAKVLIAQPSKKLVDQTLADLRTLGGAVPSRAVHEGTCDGPVRTLVRHTEEALDGGEVLIATQAALARMPYFQGADRWDLVLDEIPDAVWERNLEVPESAQTFRALFADHVEAVPEDALYYRLTPRSGGRAALERLARNERRDEVWALFSDFAGKVASDHWEVHVLQAQWARMVDGEGERLLAFAVLQPSVFEGYRSVTVLGACFEESLLARLWAGQVRFVEREGIAKGLRYREHTNGSALDIRYLFDADWSKRARDGRIEVGGRSIAVREYVRDTVQAEFGAGPFLWMANNDIGNDLFGGGAVRLSGKCHGQNGFQHVHDVAVLSAINPSSAFFEFMRTRGIDPEEVKTALYRQAVYQAVMRCSLRNPEDRHRKRVVVVDRATAEWLAGLFPGSRVSPLGEAVGALGGRKIGRPRVYADDAARKAASRAQKAVRLLCQLDEAAAHPAAALAGSAFVDRFATEAAGLVEHAGDPDAFVEGLRRCHAAVLTSKDENFLFSPAVFDALRASESGTKRGNANVVSLWGIWLDNDGGDLPQEAFAALFPALRMACFNSYSSRPGAVRYRVFIPTTCAMSVEAHRSVVRQIADALRRHGYGSPEEVERNPRLRVHGFDRSKFTPASLFYAPCQAAAGPEASFFADHAGPGRAPLDVRLWVANPIVHDEEEPDPAGPMTGGSEWFRTTRERLASGTETRRDAAITEWRTNGILPGRGRTGLYKLALRLARSGMDAGELRMALWSAAGLANSPAERRAEIDGLVRALRSKGAVR